MIECALPAGGSSSRLLYLSSSCVRSNSATEAVEKLSGITPNIELSGGTSHDEGLLDKLEKIKEEKNINFLIHGYFPPPMKHFILNFADTGQRTRDFIRESVRYAKALGVGYYSVHSGFKADFGFKDELLTNPGGESYSEDGISENIEWFGKEFPGIKLAVENLYPNNRNGECCFLLRPEEITGFLTREKTAYLLLDLGHLQVSARFFGFDFAGAADMLLSDYAGRVMEIHLSENKGDFDDHGLIHEGSVQLEIVRRHADGILENGINLVVEARNSPHEELALCYNLVCERVFAAK